MAITPESRELLRISILRVLDENATKFGLTTEAIVSQITRYGHRELRADVEHEIEYLMQKGLVTHLVKLISPELRLWVIHANGRDFLAEHGF